MVFRTFLVIIFFLVSTLFLSCNQKNEAIKSNNFLSTYYYYDNMYDNYCYFNFSSTQLSMSGVNKDGKFSDFEKIKTVYEYSNLDNEIINIFLVIGEIESYLITEHFNYTTIKDGGILIDDYDPTNPDSYMWGNEIYVSKFKP